MSDFTDMDDRPLKVGQTVLKACTTPPKIGIMEKRTIVRIDESNRLIYLNKDGPRGAPVIHFKRLYIIKEPEE